MRGQTFLKIIASYIELILRTYMVLCYLFIKISIIVEQNLI